MTQATYALDRHQRVGFGVQFLQCVVGGDAGAQQRRGIHRRQAVGNTNQPGRAGIDHLGVAAIRGGARPRLVFAVDEVAATAPDTYAAVAAQKTKANAVTDAPSAHLFSQGVDDADDLMPGYHRLARVGAQTLNGEDIAVAHAATVHAKPHMTGLQPEQLALHQFKLPLPCDLKSAIRRHAKPPLVCEGVRPRTGRCPRGQWR